jgi:hypothetical protein
MVSVNHLIMASKRYLRELNTHQREVYCHHCWGNWYDDYVAVQWCNQTFGPTRKRWQVKIIPAAGYRKLFMFRNHADAVLFQLRWGE